MGLAWIKKERESAECLDRNVTSISDGVVHEEEISLRVDQVASWSLTSDMGMYPLYPAQMCSRGWRSIR